jgi:hypothetical protein
MTAPKSDSASNYVGREMRDNANTGLGWAAVAFVFVITLFGVVLIGHAPKWPIYATILMWVGFVFYQANRK